MDAVHSESCTQGGIDDSSSVVLDPGRGISRLAATRCSGLHARRRGDFQGLAYHALRMVHSILLPSSVKPCDPTSRSGGQVGT
jgi:hypothetical protein